MSSKRFNEKYNLDKPFISTHSNPSSKELEEILLTIGVETDIFNTKSFFIDNSLLANRHSVVHGERSELSKEDFFSTFKIIMELIDAYKEVIVKAAENKEYLRRREENGG